MEHEQKSDKMEVNMDETKSVHACCGGHHGRKCSWIFRVVAIFFIIGLVTIAVGVSRHRAGNEFGEQGRLNGRYSMMNGFQTRNFQGLNNQQGGMMARFLNDSEKGNLNQVFGVITKIEGNKITTLDNGAKEQVILSTSNTVISTVNGNVGLKALKLDQNIGAQGVLNKDGALEAQVIQIQ